MRRFFLWCGLVVLVGLPVRAEAPAGKVVADVWETAYLDGARMGHQHTVVEAIDRDGRKVYRTAKNIELTVRRDGAPVTQRFLTTTEETADGKVLGLSMTQFLPGDRSITQEGRVEDGRLVVRTPSNPAGQAVPWDDKVVGLYAQDRIFAERKVKPGDRFRFLDYQIQFLSAVPMEVVVKEPEEVEVLTAGGGARAERVKKKLLRVDVTPGAVRAGGAEIPLPRLTMWLDDRWRPLREESEIPGMGRLSMCRATKAAALEEGAAPALLPDLLHTTLIKLDRPIERPHDAGEIAYRITVAGDGDPATTFSRDARQRVANIDGRTFELHVRGVREPQEVEEPGKAAGEEYLQSSFFLDSDDRTIRDLAAQVVGDEKDPWRQAQRLERWVHANMKGSTAVGFATASQVARDRTGDCRQHAMLLAALCRAAGIPSRTAVGLVYAADAEHGPFLAFHMWTEVWVKGQWLMLDATLGRGSVGAAHLKVADHSWHDMLTLAPLLPVTRVLGKVRVEVLSVKAASP
jgi:transglutaminase-like putative cysteine protease